MNSFINLQTEETPGAVGTAPEGFMRSEASVSLTFSFMSMVVPKRGPLRQAGCLDGCGSGSPYVRRAGIPASADVWPKALALSARRRNGVEETGSRSSVRPASSQAARKAVETIPGSADLIATRTVARGLIECCYD